MDLKQVKVKNILPIYISLLAQKKYSCRGYQ
jgi:hypothetical protein